jgi:hypothetical protein
MKTYTMLEIATEVAWQLGDNNFDIPRAESRWKSVDIAMEILNKDLIKDNTEDIDEVIHTYLKGVGL